MPAQRPDNHAQLPPLAAEDYTCDVCALVYAETSIDDAIGAIVGVPQGVREAMSAISPEACRVKGRHVWSVAEYLCHMRDVYVSFTVRLHRTCTETRPALEPMFNDLRAARFHYNDCDLHATLDELAAAAAGFCEQIARTEERDWDRVATRLPDEERTARWLVRQAMHEGIHHLADIRRVGGISG
jgi:uncharacterized damage-inducible protein DinB